MTKTKLLLLSFTLLANIAIADTSVATVEKKETPFSFSIFNMAETNFYESDSSQKNSLYANWTFVKYKLKDKSTVNAWFKFQKDIQNGNKATLSDTDLYYSRSMSKYKNLSTRLSLSLVLPTSVASKDGESKYFGIKVSPQAKYQLDPATSLTYMPRYVQNAHEYKFGKDEQRLTKNQILQFFILGSHITDKFYAEMSMIYVNSWDYFGDKMSEQYLTGIEVEYEISKIHALALELGNGGLLDKYDKRENDSIKFFDKETSSITAKWIVNL